MKGARQHGNCLWPASIQNRNALLAEGWKRRMKWGRSKAWVTTNHNASADLVTVEFLWVLISPSLWSTGACHNATNLLSLTSPYRATLSDVNHNAPSCTDALPALGWQSAQHCSCCNEMWNIWFPERCTPSTEAVFFMDIADGESISLRQSWNEFDSGGNSTPCCVMFVPPEILLLWVPLCFHATVHCIHPILFSLPILLLIHFGIMPLPMLSSCLRQVLGQER